MPADIREWTELASQHERLAGPADAHADAATSARDQDRDGRERAGCPAAPDGAGARRDWAGIALAARTRRWRSAVTP